MQQTDVERFVNDLGKKASLLENVRPTATGLASIVAVGKSLDYNITPDEVKSYLRLDNRQKITSKRLDATADHKHSSSVAALPGIVRTTALAGAVKAVPTGPVPVEEKFPGFAAVVVLIVVVVAVAT
ncbi:hypothetical protein [Ensifer aridi]|uniref:hypothetical protein n=1 Tax=Ensifer aridi TaxID=1708715 RepID=UPI000A108761|nr:hypothetical protein [Ensifer aridi]